MDFRTYREKKSGWWIEERSSVPCILPKDGLLAVFLLKDVEALMDNHYPSKGKGQEKRWFFNETFDREIAEIMDDRVYANPQVLYYHFLNKSKPVEAPAFERVEI